ncbi:hypothetical protein AWH49_13515 [Domibacillus aminovorans]|uniref:Uncharacterized protein n=1 Tax=Domibacillus aminovorans TaxID=29332 RepID=A0A177L765_9BACI|nr:hypothetical protein AWH49_13515 [Domibacillus aminovorans]
MYEESIHVPLIILTVDPLEEKNLADPAFATEQSANIQQVLTRMLEEQCKQKRISPTSGNVPGMPACRCTEE